MSDSNKFDAEKLADLLATVKDATGPDRELDSAIAWASGWDAHGSVGQTWRQGYENLVTYGSHSVCRAADNFGMPRYTDSIDASLALVEQMLPGWIWVVERREPVEPMDFRAAVYAPDMSIGMEGYAMTAPLAILIAMLSGIATLPNTQGKA